MLYKVVLREDGRIGASSLTHDMGAGAVSVDMPESFDPEKQADWRIVDGAPVYDPLPEPPVLEDTVTLDTLANENRLLRAQVQALADQNDVYDELIAEMAMEVYK